MTIYSEMSNGVLLLRPHQSVDHTFAEEISERLAIAINDGVRSVVMDLSEARYASGALLRTVLELVNAADGQARHIAIVAASRQFQMLIDACGADRFVKTYPSLEEAQNALAQLAYGARTHLDSVKNNVSPAPGHELDGDRDFEDE